MSRARSIAMPSLGVLLAGALACEKRADDGSAPARAEGSAAAPVATAMIARTGDTRPTSEAQETPAGERRATPDPENGDDTEVVQPVEDPSGAALEGFFHALARTETGRAGALTRVLHMGDSSIGLDGLPHAIRRRMQDRFGDGGAGFVLLDRFSPNYKNNAVTIRSNDAWKICYIAYLCKSDGHYGLGGHTFKATSAGASSVLRTRTRGAYGREVSHFELWYAVQPHGGRIRIRVDRSEPEIVDTRAETLEDRWHELRVQPGAHTFRIAAAGHGRVRIYGAVLETDGPGVVWDTVSMIGAFTRRLHGYDDEHIAGQVARRDPDLLVLNYGGNDLRRFVSRSADGPEYKKEYREVIRKLRGGKPGLSCLVVSVIDHGRSGSHTVEPSHIEAMVKAQREVAFEQGCAFFDSVAAMGGPGSLRRWLEKKPRLAEPDLKHLNHRGRDRMGEMIYAALIDAYRRFEPAVNTRQGIGRVPPGSASGAAG